MRITQILTADFETTTTNKRVDESFEEYRERVKEFEVSVYSWSICLKLTNKIKVDDYKNYYLKKVNGNKYLVFDGINLFEFIQTLEQFQEDMVLYFHNGSKFDLHFLLPYLDFLDYKQLMVKKDNLSDMSNFELDEEKEYENLILLDKPRRVQPKEYSMLVDGSHKIMEMKIGIKSTKTTNGKVKNRAVIIRDSNLMFPSRLADYGNSLNDHYNCWTEFDEKGKGVKGAYSKLDLDNGYTREEIYKDYDEFINDGNEQEYLHMDVIILCEFLHMMCDVIPFHKWGITAAGTTYKIWKYDFFGKELIKKAEKEGKIIKYTHKSGFVQYKFAKGKKLLSHKFLVDKLFEKMFPTKWLDNFYITGIEPNFNFIHSSYQGGLTMSNPSYAGKKQEHCIYIDINSSYPTQMNNNFFPFGEPYIGDSGNDEDLKLVNLRIKEVKNEKGLPFIYDFLKAGEGKHYPYTIKNKEYLITDIEFERFKKYYKGEYEWDIAVSFNKVSGDFLFGEFIKYFYILKSETTSIAEKIYAKLMLNSLYGKFGQDIARESKLYIEGQWESIETIENAKFYLPLATYITAYARMYMVDATGYKFDTVITLDTDSLTIRVPKDVYFGTKDQIKKYLEKYYDVNIHPKNLGGWDIEYMVDWVIARRAKQYMLMTKEGKKVIKFAGLRLNEEQLERVDENSFVYGMEGFEQLRPYRTPTGLILETYEKELKAIWEYNLNPDYWFQDEKEFKKEVN